MHLGAICGGIFGKIISTYYVDCKTLSFVIIHLHAHGMIMYCKLADISNAGRHSWPMAGYHLFLYSVLFRVPFLTLLFAVL
jgi:hypothetical protein